MSESDVKPTKAGQLKVGNYIVYDDDVYIVKSAEKSKAGKHGHAKIRMTVENLFTGNKKSVVAPGDDKFMVPIIEKHIAQVISVTSDSVQLMDQESYETYEAAKPEAIELESGVFVDIWYVMGRKIIRNTRADAGASADDYS